ncbi:MAG: YbbR-like domain-containing protein [Roseiflexaceae bacterium]
MNTLSNGWRLMWSFVVAFVLWMFVTYTQNPDGSQLFDVPLQIKNLPANMVVIDENGVVQTSYGVVPVMMRAAKNTINQIRDVDLQAEVDLSNATPNGEPQEFSVRPATTRDDLGYYTFDEIKKVKLRIDEMQTSELPIEIDQRNNSMANIAFEMPNVTIEGLSTTVQIQAPRMLMNRIKQAKVVIENSASMTASYQSEYPVVVVDRADKPITGITLTPATVNVKVEVRAKVGSKQVLVKPQTRGYVAAGYRLREIRVNPVLMSISGGYKFIEAINSVTTQPIDISNLTETITQTVQIVVPENISFYEYDQQNKITVDVGLVIEKDLQPTRMRIPVAITLVDVPDGVTVQVSPAIVTLDVLMSPAALQRGALTQVQAVVAVGQWDATTTTRAVVITVPKDVELIGGNTNVQLSVVEVAPTQVTEEPTATEAQITPVTLTPTLSMTVTPTKAVP